MNINKVTRYIQANRLALHYDDRTIVDLWSPHTPVAPFAVRRAIYAHREQLHAMMHAGDTRVCSSPQLHKHSWCKGVCMICRKLDRSILGLEREKPMPILQLKPKQRVIDGRVMTVSVQFRRCNKPQCHCHRPGSKRHGPYRYGYYYENGKLCTRYIGKGLPTEEQLPSAG